ncbi:helix-turn-helix domain-containing protein [Mucilaginibacter sp. JRF]|uniref:helix-turn-helix domain-containing protein n=1 Tax=Mucilaginibacter sp. JRF TaxID=2780088 RepID=UPI00187FBE75|nr:helix-turn-helix domain-containing protein [Mucilaginibacter sp. JRF]MBE9583102.1 helix-turn-helix domain-containing protein [Mucilaginibacter sp. JRF]
MAKNKAAKESILPLQKLLEGDYLRVIPLHENVNALSVTPHRHDHYEILYITEGRGHQFINFKQYEVKPGRVYFLHPGQVHLIDRFKRNGWLIMFGHELFSRFLDIHKHEDEVGVLDSYTAHPYVDMNQEQGQSFQAIIDLMIPELASPKPDADILMHYTALLLLQLNRMHVLQHPVEYSAVATRFGFYKIKQLIEANFKIQHQAAFYAGELQADIKKLNRICRESTGLTVAELLRERLLTESKILLQTSALSIKQISYDLGFNDPAFFGRFFKQQTTLTPAQFRALRLI